MKNFLTSCAYICVCMCAFNHAFAYDTSYKKELSDMIYDHQKSLPPKPKTEEEWSQYKKWRQKLIDLNNTALEVVKEEIYNSSRSINQEEEMFANKYINLLFEKTGVKIDEIRIMDARSLIQNMDLPENVKNEYISELQFLDTKSFIQSITDLPEWLKNEYMEDLQSENKNISSSKRALELLLNNSKFANKKLRKKIYDTVSSMLTSKIKIDRDFAITFLAWSEAKTSFSESVRITKTPGENSERKPMAVDKNIFFEEGDTAYKDNYRDSWNWLEQQKPGYSDVTIKFKNNDDNKGKYYSFGIKNSDEILGCSYLPSDWSLFHSGNFGIYSGLIDPREHDSQLIASALYNNNLTDNAINVLKNRNTPEKFCEFLGGKDCDDVFTYDNKLLKTAEAIFIFLFPTGKVCNLFVILGEQVVTTTSGKKILYINKLSELARHLELQIPIRASHYLIEGISIHDLYQSGFKFNFDTKIMQAYKNLLTSTDKSVTIEQLMQNLKKRDKDQEPKLQSNQYQAIEHYIAPRHF